MKNFGRLFRIVLGIVLIIALVILVLTNYSFVFSKTITGEILEVERVTEPLAIVGGAPIPTAQTYSFAMAIRAKDGEIFTASSEDRQWAIARKGACVEAQFYPYPPWNLERAGTYFNARLKKLLDCKTVGITPGQVTAPAPAPAEESSQVPGPSGQAPSTESAAPPAAPEDAITN